MGRGDSKIDSLAETSGAEKKGQTSGKAHEKPALFSLRCPAGRVPPSDFPISPNLLGAASAVPTTTGERSIYLKVPLELETNAVPFLFTLTEGKQWTRITDSVCQHTRKVNKASCETRRSARDCGSQTTCGTRLALPDLPVF